MNIQPYLSFEGRAQEAIDFYKGAVGASEKVVMHFKDAPPDVQAQLEKAAHRPPVGLLDSRMHRFPSAPVFSQPRSTVHAPRPA